MQWKLLGGIGLVMALFLMAKYGVFGDLWGLVTGRPETWSQFTGTNAEAKIDTRLPRTTADRSPFDPMIGVQQPIQPIAAEPKKEAPAAAAAEPGWLPGLDPKSLEVVEDNTVFRGGETETWYRLCSLVAKSDPADLAKRSLGPVRFVQLFQQPGSYRGKIVTVTGRVRTAEYFEAMKNEEGIEGYTKCALLPSDGSNSPIFVYVIDMPKGFPLAKKLGEIDEEVTFQGVFYKRYAYHAQDVPRAAPLLVARTLQWKPYVPKPPDEVPWVTLGVLLVISAVAGVTIAVVALRRLTPASEDLPSDWKGLPKEK